MNLKMVVAAFAALSLLSVAAQATPKKLRSAGSAGRVRAKSLPPADVNRRDPNAVYFAGTYVGSDPDPRVRAQMLREAPHGTGDSN